MRALAAAERSERAHKEFVEKSVSEAPDVDMDRQEIEISNRVLPRVHSLWPHVVQGLRHPSVVVCVFVVPSDYSGQSKLNSSKESSTKSFRPRSVWNFLLLKRLGPSFLPSCAFACKFPGIADSRQL